MQKQFFCQSLTAADLQNVFNCLTVQYVWLDCFVAVIMTHYQLTPPFETISKKLFLPMWFSWHLEGFNCDYILERLTSIRWKKHFFLSDNDISAALLVNRETPAGVFGAKLSPKVFCSTTISSSQFMSPWCSMKNDWSSGTITYNF